MSTLSVSHPFNDTQIPGDVAAEEKHMFDTKKTTDYRTVTISLLTYDLARELLCQ